MVDCGLVVTITYWWVVVWLSPIRIGGLWFGCHHASQTINHTCSTAKQVNLAFMQNNNASTEQSEIGQINNNLLITYQQQCMYPPSQDCTDIHYKQLSDIPTTMYVSTIPRLYRHTLQTII